jgi:Flp pilus assembly protein TadG
VSKRGRSSQHGAAAVEFAIILPLLVSIVLGTIDWGYYFFVQQIVTNAAREGARVGTLYDPATPGSEALALADAEVTAKSYLDRAGLEAAGATTLAAPNGNAIVVTVTYTTGSLTGFMDLIPLLPERARAVAEMRR